MSTTPGQKPSASPTRDARRRNSMIRIAVLLVIGAAAVGYMAYRAQGKSAQAEATRRVRVLGGSVMYNYNGARSSEPQGPAWLRTVLGDEYFVTVDGIQIVDPNLTDQTVVELVDHLQRLPDLQLVELTSPKLTDACLEALGKLTQVRKIQIVGDGLTPEALKKLDDALPRGHVTQTP